MSSFQFEKEINVQHLYPLNFEKPFGAVKILLIIRKIIKIILTSPQKLHKNLSNKFRNVKYIKSNIKCTKINKV